MSNTFHDEMRIGILQTVFFIDRLIGKIIGNDFIWISTFYSSLLLIESSYFT